MTASGFVARLYGMLLEVLWLWDQADKLADAYAALTPCMTRPPHIGRRFPFAEAPAAMRYLQSGGSVGKVVLELPPLPILARE